MLVICSQYAIADEASDALMETQSLLRDPVRVQNEALITQDAQNADRNASIVTLGKPELKQDLYNISADLMSWIVEATQGDPAKMQQFVKDAAANPRAFYEKMPASERTKIKSLSEKIDSSRTKNKYP